MACGLAITLISCTDEPRPAGPDGEKTPQPPAHPSQGAPGAGDPYYPNDGNGGYDALDYQVKISYDPSDGHLEGDSTLEAKATQKLTRFNLDLRELEVDSVEVDGKPAEFRHTGEFELVITPAEPIDDASEFTTRVRYQGTPGSNAQGGVGQLGWLKTESGASYALGEPHSAAFWYPVNETPRDKATFQLSARVPEGWIAVSGGREKGKATKDGWTTYTWQETNPVASYLTTVAIDKFTIDRSKLSNGVPVLSAYAPGAENMRRVEANLDEVVRFLSKKFGPYPQTAAGGIYLSESIPFALETQGRPSYANWADVRVVVHEYAHQWFGNSVSIKSWSDLCLNECFASYTEWLWHEAKDGADLDELYRGDVSANPPDSQFWANKLHKMGVGKEFDGMYDKSKLAMHALRRKVGDQVFDRVLKEWPEAHRHGNASWPEFERFVSERTDEDLGEFFDAWFRGDERPPDEHLYPGKLRP
ncbi:MAG: M1 family peptidase [Actinophytocola sp.]|nr:M1 family peptidase [Actinophytocola sp.]